MRGTSEKSWRNFGAAVQNVLLALLLWVARGEGCDYRENSLEWLCADLAISPAGSQCGRLTDLVGRHAPKILGHSRCRTAFVQNATASVGCSISSLSSPLSHIVVMDGRSRTCRMPCLCSVGQTGRPLKGGAFSKFSNRCMETIWRRSCTPPVLPASRRGS